MQYRLPLTGLQCNAWDGGHFPDAAAAAPVFAGAAEDTLSASHSIPSSTPSPLKALLALCMLKDWASKQVIEIARLTEFATLGRQYAVAPVET